MDPAWRTGSVLLSMHRSEIPRQRHQWPGRRVLREDRKSTRLNSSHLVISYAVFCLKKKKKTSHETPLPTINPTDSIHHPTFLLTIYPHTNILSTPFLHVYIYIYHHFFAPAMHPNCI